MRLYTKEDFRGIEIQDNWTSLDVLAAVASEIHKKEFPNNSCFTKSTIKNKKLMKKNELVRVNEHMINKKKANHCLGQKGKRSLDVESIIFPELPQEFRNAIKYELNGGRDFTGEVMFVGEKSLHPTDISKHANRFMFPFSNVKCGEFLTENEKESLETRIEKNKHSFMEVMIIEPSLAPGMVNLRIWETTGKLNYVLNGTWMDIVTRNRLKEGAVVQLWAFRIGEELCFALRKLPLSVE